MRSTGSSRTRSTRTTPSASGRYRRCWWASASRCDRSRGDRPSSRPRRQYAAGLVGAGGKLLAWHMARVGRRTAVVERRYIGGSCPNINCMPSKNEIWSAKVSHLVRHAAQFGTSITGSATVDMAKVRQRKRDMVEAEVAAHLENYRASGAQLIMGTGRFVGPKTLEVRLNDGGTRTLVGDHVFINVGTRPAIPNVPGLE